MTLSSFTRLFSAYRRYRSPSARKQTLWLPPAGGSLPGPDIQGVVGDAETLGDFLGGANMFGDLAGRLVLELLRVLGAARRPILRL